MPDVSAPQQRAAVESNSNACGKDGRAERSGCAQHKLRRLEPAIRSGGVWAQCSLACQAVQHVLSPRGRDCQRAC